MSYQAKTFAQVPATTRLLMTINGRIGATNKLAKAVTAAGGKVEESPRMRGRALTDWTVKRAEELDGHYQQGGIPTAWGRFYDKLPWPKRDRKKAQQYEREAMKINPASLRARVFLASSLLEDVVADLMRPA